MASSGAIHFAPLRFSGIIYRLQTKFILEVVWVAIITGAWKCETSLKLGPLKRSVISPMHRLHLPSFSKSLWQLINWSGRKNLFFALCVDIVYMERLHVLTTSSEGILFSSVIGLEDCLGIIAESSLNIVSDRRWNLHHFLHVKILKPTFDR